MRIKPTLIAYPVAMLLLAGAVTVLASPEDLLPIEKLGKEIFFDQQLSINRNQACAACHGPEAGWTGPDSQINAHGAVYEGSIPGRFGNRKPPSSAYATLSPIFYADYGNRLVDDAIAALANSPVFVGGNFWDGRATGWELRNPAADQAQGPFLNPVEQALPDTACVVYRVCTGRYSNLFAEVWGSNACVIDWPDRLTVDQECSEVDTGEVPLSDAARQKVNQVYDWIALSIAAFEGSSESNAFTSKLDARLAGLYEFTAEEELGRQIFSGKGKCTQCHVGTPSPGVASVLPPLLTDFTYANLGVPRNPENPWYYMDVFNPDGEDWIDSGLAGFLETVLAFQQYADENYGKQKVPTLRNVALKPYPNFVKAYTHNGYFKSLKRLVHFYNTRDVLQDCEGIVPDDILLTDAVAEEYNCWPKPEVEANVNTDALGDLGLTEEEEWALVAFMEAMSDSFLVADDDEEEDD